MKKHPQRYQIGIDEVGRGPIAGPVTLGVFCVEKPNLLVVRRRLKGITDSKQLTVAQREYYFTQVKQLVKEGLCTYTTSSVGAKSIDAKGITWSIRTALSRAMTRLNIPPKKSYVFLDGGLKAPQEYVHQETIIKGDVHNWLIATASVMAKVTRDRKMVTFSHKHPQYFFEKHKGYGTKQHYKMIQKHGTCELHRKMWITP